MNKRVGAVIISCFIVALVLLAPSTVKGDEWNRATRFTINQQFEVPGAILEANTPYVIRLHDSPSTRDVVQILNEDQTKLITMFIAIRAERMDPTDETKFTFMESAPGFPLPIKDWFYPGRLSGHEFVYSKDQLARIAGYRTRATVTEQVAVAQPEPEPVVEEQESVEVAEAEPAPVDNEALEAESEGVAVAEAEPPAEEAVSEEPIQQAANELPRTAGELPLIGLLGLLCLGAGLGMRVISAKS